VVYHPNPLSPACSAVVEACAGSGKTWLLVSRLIRLLLAGAKPSELLAITFTRKAAEEMRARLFQWLEDLATQDDAAVLAFLAQRGLSENEAMAALPRARALYEVVLHSEPGPLITTFHGWFLNLLARAPMVERAPANLIEDVALLQDEAWQTWAASLRQPDKAGVAAAFNALLAELPLDSVRKLLFGFLAKRAEWWARGGTLETSSVELEALSSLDEDTDVIGTLLEDAGFLADLREFLPLLTKNGEAVKADRTRADALAVAIAELASPPPQPSPLQGEGAHLWADLQSVFLTQEGAVVSRKPGPTLDKRLGTGAGRFVELHYRLAERVLATRDRLEDQAALRLNRCGLTVGVDLLEHYQALKTARDGLDFTDAEFLTWRLLGHPEYADALLAKLDARWKHLLLDEFQDANPLQWQILLAWLAAYGADPERPSVFMVGDPKQSIYRFRRAEARIFAAARAMLARDFAAVCLEQNETRRCAPRVVAWVNAVFGDLGEDYPGFAPHTAHQAGLPGWCEMIVSPPPPGEGLGEREQGSSASTAAPSPGPAGHPLPRGEGITLRDPLSEPPPANPDKRAGEAERVAARIQDIVGRMRVADSHGERPARYADILILSASRTRLSVFEDAFKTAGIPFVSSRRGGLLDTLEVADLVALLRALVNPLDNLSLAHALKSPLFGFSDEDLKRLAAAGGPWLEALGRGESDHVGRATSLLKAWRAAAGHLPPHDLLDRIIHEGEVEARYAAAVPERLRPGVLANLRGLLELSLKLGGGRFPSLPRFLDELEAQRTRAGGDAPDEPPAAVGNVVRMLTIHAAKGLESPIVFLIKADEDRPDRDYYGALVDWPAEAAAPTHFSLYGPSGWRGRARDALFDQEGALAALEGLNLLYVAMTRAKQALFVSGLEDAKAGSWLERLRAGLASAELNSLPEMHFSSPPQVGESIPTTERHAPQHTPPPRGEGPGERVNFGETKRAAATYIPSPGPAGHLPPEGGGMGGIGRRRLASTPEIDLGIRVHRYLELATQDKPAAVIANALAGEDFAEVKAMAEAILANPRTRHFFTAGRACNELAYVGDDGQLRRIDRLVEFEDAVWVLDYKTGGLEESDLARRAAPYLEQMAAYRRAAESLYPGKPVHAALLFTDGQLLEL
jgi:ATP-dependent helicase/nuclease subunit A